jgi:hypothetical protein
MLADRKQPRAAQRTPAYRAPARGHVRQPAQQHGKGQCKDARGQRDIQQAEYRCNPLASVVRTPAQVLAQCGRHGAQDQRCNAQEAEAENQRERHQARTHQGTEAGMARWHVTDRVQRVVQLAEHAARAHEHAANAERACDGAMRVPPCRLHQ